MSVTDNTSLLQRRGTDGAGLNGQGDLESITNPGSCYNLSELRIPITECGIEVAIEDPGSCLKEQVCTLRCSLHLLFFNEVFADDLVDHRSANAVLIVPPCR